MARLKSLDAVVDELSRQHAEDQETIANNVIVALWPLWHIMDFERLDETSILWVESATPVIETAYLQSQRLAAAYEANVRFASLPTAEPMPISAPLVQLPAGVRSDHFDLPSFGDSDASGVGSVELDPPSTADIKTSLLVEGNYNIKAQMPVPEDEAMENALYRTSGAGVRQSLKGARNVTNNVLQFDRRVLGYARFTDSDPCHFCALLASRGAVYGKRSFVGSHAGFKANDEAPSVPADYVDVARVHNNCKCTLRPVYAKSQAMDDEAKFYKQQWEDSSGVLDFRDNYKPFQRKQADIVELQRDLQEREDALLDAGFDPLSPQVGWARRTQDLLAV